MRHVIRTFGHRRVALLALVAVFTVAVGAEAQAANRGKVVRYWERQLHTGGTIQLLDYRVLRCGPSACIVRWHIRAFIPGRRKRLRRLQRVRRRGRLLPRRASRVRHSRADREVGRRWRRRGRFQFAYAARTFVAPTSPRTSRVALPVRTAPRVVPKAARSALDPSQSTCAPGTSGSSSSDPCGPA